MTELTFRDASTAALAGEMREDERVWALGEDLGRGGLFGQYAGLAEEFGPTRVVDAPISESAIMGVAVGAALMGMRPVVELRLTDFALCAVDELVNQAAKNRFMFGGQSRVALVVRQPCGIGRSTAAQHSQSLESWYVHTPGLVVLAPSTPADNYGLLKAAIRSEDPVVFLEHKRLWPVSGEVEVGADPLPIGKAEKLRHGDDVTVVAWSSTVAVAAAAADTLHEVHGIQADVLDLRSLWPWDQDAVLESAARSGRLVVVHEAVRVAGLGAEIVATVAEHIGVQVRRVAAPRTPVAYSPRLEAEVLIRPDDVVAAVMSMWGQDD